MTGFFKWIVSKARFIPAAISLFVIMFIGSCLDSIPLSDWRVWIALLVSMAVLWSSARDVP